MTLQTKQLLRKGTRFTAALLICGAGKTFANPTPELCMNAVSSTKNYFEGVYKIAEQQYYKQEINRAQFKNTESELQNIQQRISLEKCMASTDQELTLFQCLVENGGNYPTCASGTSKK